MPAESLGMPKGSVHALMAIGVTSVSGYCVVRGIPVPDWWQVITFGAMGNYSLYRLRSPSSAQQPNPPVNLDEVDLMRRGNA